MNKHNLVVLKQNKPHITKNYELIPHKFYRCLTPTENECDEYMIYAEWFTQAEYDELFETVYDRMIRDWERFGLIKNGKAIAYTPFKKLASVTRYDQRGTKPLYVVFFHHQTDIYGFYPTFRDTQELSLKYAYENFLRVLDGDMIPVDQLLVQFGNWGTPVAYSPLRTLWTSDKEI
jgi:hypothetical protein